MAVPHCPHCLLPLSGQAPLPFPRGPLRCPHCRLIVGPGRARADGGDDSDAGSRGSAAGVLANAARRVDDAEPSEKGDVVVALHAAARSVGCAVERLRMLDYDERARQDNALPALPSVLATFGTWKKAREAAAAGTPRAAAS